MKDALLLLCCVALGSCSLEDDSSPRSDRFVVAVDVAVAAGVGDWAPNSSASQLCTHRSRDSITFTAFAGEESVLVNTFGSEPIDSAPLGALKGAVVSGACTNCWYSMSQRSGQ